MRPGLHHVALQVPNLDDIDRAYEDLLARGVDIVTPPTADLEPGSNAHCDYAIPMAF